MGCVPYCKAYLAIGYLKNYSEHVFGTWVLKGTIACKTSWGRGRREILPPSSIGAWLSQTKYSECQVLYRDALPSSDYGLPYLCGCLSASVFVKWVIAPNTRLIFQLVVKQWAINNSIIFCVYYQSEQHSLCPSLTFLQTVRKKDCVDEGNMPQIFP